MQDGHLQVLDARAPEDSAEWRRGREAIAVVRHARVARAAAAARQHDHADWASRGVDVPTHCLQEHEHLHGQLVDRAEAAAARLKGHHQAIVRVQQLGCVCWHLQRLVQRLESPRLAFEGVPVGAIDGPQSVLDLAGAPASLELNHCHHETCRRGATLLRGHRQRSLDPAPVAERGGRPTKQAVQGDVLPPAGVGHKLAPLQWRRLRGTALGCLTPKPHLQDLALLALLEQVCGTPDDAVYLDNAVALADLDPRVGQVPVLEEPTQDGLDKQGLAIDGAHLRAQVRPRGLVECDAVLVLGRGLPLQH
mmetsp:Transcript_19000/g.57173  ORF Transcript_19000/g.57173 Transcript_19000/m.57173 type:complete len:307 (-) Transcript_19000:466-1386(-)